MNLYFRHVRPSDVTPALTRLFNPDDPTIFRLFAVLDGRAAGRIVTDDLAHPTWGAVQEMGDGLTYLGGALDAALVSDVITAFRADGEVCVGLWPDDPRRGLLPRDPDYAGSTFDFLHRRRDGDRLTGLARRLPEGCQLRPIDRTLIERCAWRDHQIVMYGSIDGFFVSAQKSRGSLGARAHHPRRAGVSPPVTRSSPRTPGRTRRPRSQATPRLLRANDFSRTVWDIA